MEQQDLNQTQVQQTESAQATSSQISPIPTETPSQQPPKSKKKTLYIVIAVLIVLLIGSGAWFVYANNTASQEEMAYQILENNDNPQDYQDFLEKYPNSEHADEVRQRLTKLEEMLAKWNTIALSDNVNDFINFKNTYNDIQYGRLCDIKIDSLDFIIAQKQGTPEAYQHYLDSHPDGRYASEASIAQGTLRDQEVDEQDRQQICSVVTEFFNGFASLDDNRICANIASTMDKFLKHSNVNKSNVLSTIHGMFNEHIQSCQFNVNRDFQIKRNGSSYIATFTVDQHIERDNEGKTFGQYKCTAVISEQMLITSLTMDEISSQQNN